MKALQKVRINRSLEKRYHLYVTENGAFSVFRVCKTSVISTIVD